VTYTQYQPHPFESGTHLATLVSAAFRAKQSKFGSPYSVLQATFANEQGAEASLWVPDFSKRIPDVFTALGDSESSLEHLLALRGSEAIIQVSHTQRGDNCYANVVAINGKRVTA
jgi:hypothetical protein